MNLYNYEIGEGKEAQNTLLVLLKKANPNPSV
jgi:hypothetical protein